MTRGDWVFYSKATPFRDCDDLAMHKSGVERASFLWRACRETSENSHRFFIRSQFLHCPCIFEVEGKARRIFYSLIIFFLYIKLLDPLPLFTSVILSFLILSLWVPAHEIPPMTRSWGENPTGKADQVFRDSKKLPPAFTLKMISVFLMAASIDYSLISVTQAEGLPPSLPK